MLSVVRRSPWRQTSSRNCAGSSVQTVLRVSSVVKVSVASREGAHRMRKKSALIGYAVTSGQQQALRWRLRPSGCVCKLNP